MHTATYTVVLHPTEPFRVGFVAEVPAMPGCFAHGDTVKETTIVATETVVGYLNLLVLYAEPIPCDIMPAKLASGCLIIKVGACFNPATMRWVPAPNQHDISV